jgi:DNA-binding MarR family transcriptional regulator
LTLTDIARISGVSRPTLYELRARYGGSTSDLQLAVLQTVASRPGVLGSDLARHVGRPLKEVFAVVQAFADQGFIDYEPSEGRPSEPVSFATAEGFDLLENWSFDDQVRDEQESG